MQHFQNKRQNEKESQIIINSATKLLLAKIPRYQTEQTCNPVILIGNADKGKSINPQTKRFLSCVIIKYQIHNRNTAAKCEAM